MKIFYDTEDETFYTLTRSRIDPGNIKMYAPFVLPLDKNLWCVNALAPCIVLELASVAMNRTGIKIFGTQEPMIIPSFIKVLPGLGTAVEADLTFRPESDQRLFLIINLDDGISSLMTVAEREAALEFFKAGVPNVFTDSGNLCVGKSAVPNPSDIVTKGVYHWMSQWVDAWSSAAFNADLLNSYHLKTLMFNPETRTNIPIGEKWRETYEPLPDPNKPAMEAVKGVWNVKA